MNAVIRGFYLLWSVALETESMMSHKGITFFMPVIDSVAIMADYTIASYAKLRDSHIPFTLLVYPNFLSPRIKEKHIPKWKRYEYVEIADTAEQEATTRPSPWKEEDDHIVAEYHVGALQSGSRVYKWLGPWERHDVILDTELHKIDSEYVATVDADFEILNGDFIGYIIERMEQNPNLKVVSSDYSPTSRYNSSIFRTGYCYLHERYSAWFCVYKREALLFPESHRYRDKFDPASGEFYAWDTSAYLQQRLREERGYEMEAIAGFDRSFIHYGAFAKNRSITSRNVSIYRALKLAAKMPLGAQVLPYDPARHRFASKIDRRITWIMVELLFRRLFDESERHRPIYADARGAQR